MDGITVSELMERLAEMPLEFVVVITNELIDNRNLSVKNVDLITKASPWKVMVALHTAE